MKRPRIGARIEERIWLSVDLTQHIRQKYSLNIKRRLDIFSDAS